MRNDRSITILLANDGSEHVKAAINLICDLPLAASSKVIQIGVLLPRESSNHSILENILEQSKQVLNNHNIEVESNLILGYPQEVLVDEAADIKPDLMIIGAKGLRSTLGILLGGVAQQIVEYACCPTLVVRGPYTGLKRLLFATDGSNSSQYALDYLTGRMKETHTEPCQRFIIPIDTRIDIVHVCPPVPSPELISRSWSLSTEILPTYIYDEDFHNKWINEQKPRGMKIVDQATNELNKCGYQAKGCLLWGDAATEIIDFVNQKSIDLIITGSRGLSQLHGLLLGSVTRKLVHYASCSVLIVKKMN